MGATGVTRSAASPPQSAWLTALAAIAALDLFLFGWYLKAALIRAPFWDMYSWILHYLDYRAGREGWWAYLWASHDVHRPVWIRLLTAFDIEAFGGVSYPFIAVAVFAHAVTAWLLWRECRRGVAGPCGRALGSLALMIVLTSVAAVDCAIPLTSGYVHVLAVVVLTFVLFDGESEGAAALVRWRRVGAMLAAVSAPFASAVGWAVWPIVFWTAWRGGASRRWLLAIVSTGLALAVAYFRGLSIAIDTGTAAGPAADWAAQWLARADYLLTFLGLPWTRAAPLAVAGRLCGAILLAAGLWVVVSRGLVRAPASRLERIAVALIMFSLSSAVLATAGRAGVTGPVDVLVPVRYSVLLTPLHVGLLWMAAPALARLLTANRSRSPTAAALVCAGLLLLVQQVAAGQAGAARTQTMRSAIERFEAGESDPGMATVVYVDLEQARRELEIMRRAGVYQYTR